MLPHLNTEGSDCKFELYEDDEVGDGGGEHAGEGAPPDLEHPAA